MCLLVRVFTAYAPSMRAYSKVCSKRVATAYSSRFHASAKSPFSKYGKLTVRMLPAVLASMTGYFVRNSEDARDANYSV